jgi:U3 small nucleolar ribonucleoprotein protein IMP3
VKFAPEWNKGSNIREIKILRKYLVQNREDYTKYNKICGLITSLVSRLKHLPDDDPVRMEITGALLEKWFVYIFCLYCFKSYNLGLIKSKKSLVQLKEVSASKFCRRRLPVVLVRMRFAENLTAAVEFIEQGRLIYFCFIVLTFLDIRVGTSVVTNPSLLLTRQMEDYITWSDNSKIKRKVQAFNDELDDYDLLGE